ncbi:hypothetical protein HDU85_006086 [Gaertneriomyces sp. JEL0708]|nr:hypothetical protein HDU85_006086 [Gaertneriomyces sp. JEL0708]
MDGAMRALVVQICKAAQLHTSAQELQENLKATEQTRLETISLRNVNPQLTRELEFHSQDLRQQQLRLENELSAETERAGQQLLQVIRIIASQTAPPVGTPPPPPPSTSHVERDLSVLRSRVKDLELSSKQPNTQKLDILRLEERITRLEQAGREAPRHAKASASDAEERMRTRIDRHEVSVKAWVQDKIGELETEYRDGMQALLNFTETLTRDFDDIKKNFDSLRSQVDEMQTKIEHTGRDLLDLKTSSSASVPAPAAAVMRNASTPDVDNLKSNLDSLPSGADKLQAQLEDALQRLQQPRPDTNAVPPTPVPVRFAPVPNHTTTPSRPSFVPGSQTPIATTPLLPGATPIPVGLPQYKRDSGSAKPASISTPEGNTPGANDVALADPELAELQHGIAVLNKYFQKFKGSLFVLARKMEELESQCKENASRQSQALGELNSSLKTIKSERQQETSGSPNTGSSYVVLDD